MTDPPTPAEEPQPEQLDRHELQARAIKGASWTMIHTLVSVPFAFLVNILIARFIGVIDYGRLAFLSTVMEVVGGLISMGLGVGLIQYGSQYHAQGRHADVQDLLSKSQGFRLLVDIPVLTLVVVLVAHVSLPLTIVAIVFGVVVPAAFGGATTCLGIENKTAENAQNAMISNILLQIAVTLTVIWVGTADAIWAVRLAMGAVAILLALLRISPTYRVAVMRPKLPRHFPAGFWNFAIPAGLAGVVGTLVVSRTEVLALTWMHQLEAAGTFALAFGLSVHLFSPAQALIGPLVPAISGLRAIDEDSVQRAFYRTMRGTSTVVALMLAMVLPTFGVLIVPIYGEQYRTAAPVFIALGVGAGILVLSGPVQAFVQSRLQGWALLRVNLIALAVDVALILIAVPRLGVWGAVVANLSAALTQFLLYLIPEIRQLGVSWKQLIGATLPLYLGIGSGLAAWFASKLAPNWVVGTIAAAVIGTGLLLGLLRLTRSGLAPDDSVAIIQTLPQKIRPFAGTCLACITRRSA